MTKSEISKRRYAEERVKLLTLPWKDKIYIDDIWFCPVCDFKSKSFSAFASHVGNKDLYEKMYLKYFGGIKTFCKTCGKPTRFVNFKTGYKTYCCEECTWPDKRQRIIDIKDVRTTGYIKYRSNDIKVMNRNLKAGKAISLSLKKYFENEPPEHLKHRSDLQSNTMKTLIKEGNYFPKINNVYNGKVLVYNGIRYRSSWDLLFHILHPTYEYEKIIIPYVSPIDNKLHNYIVDFVDETKRMLYEVKPIVRQNDILNMAKTSAALLWCKEKGYYFNIIDETYLKKHVNKSIFETLPKDVKRRLNCLLK